ncbi:MAG: molecular chaperone SurA [Gammaproteobacteria bacterium]|nr:molecular chaperone SurA [Gammaproteobacteria bacterium]
MRKLIAISIIGLFPLSAAGADDVGGELLDRIVAVADDGIVLQSELDSRVTTIKQQLTASNTEIPPDDVLQEQVLESLIVKNLQQQLAERAGIVIADAQLNAALEQIARRNNTTLGELPAVLASEGIAYFDFREELRDELALNQLRQREIISRIEISQLEVDQMLEASGQTSDKDYNISHILVALPADADQAAVATALEKAGDLTNRLREGEDFGRLAVAYSNGQQALNGGALGWRKGRELPTLFAEQVVKMERGDISQPMRSSSGFHIIRLNDVRGENPVYEQQTNARHILIMPDELNSDEQAREKLSEIRVQLLEGADFGDLARTVSDDPGSAPRGGELGWNGPNTFVPEFNAAMAALAPGEISEPFRTQFGWHIVQLLERREQDTSDANRRNQAYMAIRARKAEEELQMFVRRLRDEAYVDIRL